MRKVFCNIPQAFFFSLFPSLSKLKLNEAISSSKRAQAESIRAYEGWTVKNFNFWKN